MARNSTGILCRDRKINLMGPATTKFLRPVTDTPHRRIRVKIRNLRKERIIKFCNPLIAPNFALCSIFCFRHFQKNIVIYPVVAEGDQWRSQ